MARGFVGLIIAALLLAGCLGPATPKKTTSYGPDPTSPTPSPSPTPAPTPTLAPENETEDAPENETMTEQKPWPAPGSASIRPGVQAFADGSQCTTNFVFRNANNSTLYLGLAAHCVDGLAIGAPVEIDGARYNGRLVFSSWISQNLDCPVDPKDLREVPAGCDNDFALIEIDPRDRDEVSPAVLYYGGPTRLDDSKRLEVNDRLLFYGNSGLRMGVEETNPHEGFVTSEQGDSPVFYAMAVTPGVPGDSGSGVLTRAGAAAGVLVTVSADGENGIVGLKQALEFASRHGTNATLATWPQMNDGSIP